MIASRVLRSIVLASLLVGMASCVEDPIAKCQVGTFGMPLAISGVVFCFVSLLLFILIVVIYRAHIRYITRKMMGLERAKKKKPGKHDGSQK